MKLSYIEKLEAVKRAKGLLIKRWKVEWYTGICNCLSAAQSYPVGEEFRELYTFKPEDVDATGYWWPRDADHLQTRIDVLENLEKIYESKVTFWGRLTHQIKNLFKWN